MALIRNVDPITFEVLSHRLHQITREMGITLERTGGTVTTTQQHDYNASLYRPDGDIMAAGETYGQHVVCAGFAVKRIRERFSADEIYADDIFLLNDPYLAAIHNSDVYVISPIHFKNELVGWSATFVHVSDVGAMTPGGDSPDATEVFQEGIRFPGIKLVERGRLRRDVFDAFTHMTRQPDAVGLDLKCEIAANNVAKARVQAMYEQYGPEMMNAVSTEMIHYTETVLRSRLRDITDGTWSETLTIEADGPRRLKLTLRKEGDQLTFDFTGTDKQVSKGINLPYHGTAGFCFGAILSSLAYDLPKNHGVLRPMTVIAPEGTLVNVKYPGPISMSTTSSGFGVGFLASSVLMQMLATSEKWRNEIVAPNASHRNCRHSGVNQYGRYSAFINMAHGALDGNGARINKDGVDSGGSYIELSQRRVDGAALSIALFISAPRERQRRGGHFSRGSRRGIGPYLARCARRQDQRRSLWRRGAEKLGPWNLRRLPRRAQHHDAYGEHQSPRSHGEESISDRHFRARRQLQATSLL